MTDPRLEVVKHALTRPMLYAGPHRAFASSEELTEWQARAVLVALDLQVRETEETA